MCDYESSGAGGRKTSRREGDDARTQGVREGVKQPKGLRFDEFRAHVKAYGYRLGRISGSHHIYYHPDVPSPLNIQPDRDGMAKPYQVRDFLEDVADYLADEDTRR